MSAEPKDTESLIVSEPPKRSLSSAFALVFMLGFNAALIAAAAYTWNTECDAPLKGFLVSYAIVGLVSCGLFFLQEFMGKELPGGKSLPYVIFFAFVLSGITGTMYYSKAERCVATATLLYKWAFAAVLAFAIFIWLVISVPLVKVITPLLGKLMKAVLGIVMVIMGMFTALAAGCESFSKSDSKASGASVFAYYVNCSALCWFFSYFVIEVWRHYDAACDQPLHIFILIFGTLGTFLTLCVFYWEVLGPDGPAPGTGGSSQTMRIFLTLFAACMVWGALGANWYHSAKTCEDTAPTIFRLAGLLVLAFYVVLAMLALIGAMLGLDFLCSGRLRVVVILDNQ